VFAGKRILITGATGTMGRALVSDLLNEQPEVIRLLSRDEDKQFHMQYQYRDYPNLRFFIGDVRDRDRIRRAMEGVDYVFHCAALKHVPSCEYNPFEAVRTNVLGTQNVIEAAMDVGVARLVATSSDKAISPTNTMGATKLLAERLIAAAEFYRGAHQTVFCGVRFGNVIGSRGSVIPFFVQQILTERRVTVTDPNMTRFMMTVGQAVELTKRALRLAHGGEIFVLKMPVVRLSDLADVVIDQVCRRKGWRTADIRVEISGARPGEKMYEELMTLEEAEQAAELPDMFAVLPLFSQKDCRYDYDGAVPAQPRVYSSHTEKPMDREQLLRLLEQSGVIDECMAGEQAQ